MDNSGIFQGEKSVMTTVLGLMKDPNTEPIRTLRWLEIYQIGQALLNRDQHRRLEMCTLLLLSAAGCNTQSRNNFQVWAGWQGNSKTTLTSMINPSSRHSGDLVTPCTGSSPVKNEIKRNKPHYPRLAEGAELMTGEMLSVSPGTTVNIC